MKKIFSSISEWILSVGVAFRSSWKEITGDVGALIFFILLPLAYPIVYTLIYNPEVVTNIPIAVVDNSRTAASRELVRMAEAAPSVQIYDYVPNMGDAKRLIAEEKVYAVMYIPADYSRKLGRNEQTTVTLYCDMSLLLRYRALLSTMTSLQLELASKITAERVAIYGLDAAGGMTELPVNSDSHFLGDTQQGFASFIIPGIVVLILQQSMILGIALLGATREERRRKNGLTPEPRSAAKVIGRALSYVMLYIPASIYILHYVPEMFNLPHYGSAIDYLLFIFPMLLASAFLGQLVVHLCREREDTFLVVVFTSVVFLFLSGLTWPRYAMSAVWKFFGDLVPATWGVEGFIRINSNSATLAENSTPFIALWVLTAIYFLAAWLIKRSKK